MNHAHNRMKLMRSPNLVSLDPNDQDQVHAAAELHRELLSDSPVAQLGYRFMTKFYYSKLVEARLIRCDLYSYKGTYVAFSAYTKYPFTFMRQGKRRHFVYLSFLLFQSLLLGPRRLKTIFKVIGRSYRRGQDRKDKTGEVLSFGVLAPYRNLKDEVSEHVLQRWSQFKLLVPVSLGGTAHRIVSATEVRATVGSNESVTTENRFRGLNPPLSSPYLDDQSTSTWYVGDFKRQFVWHEVWPLQTFRQREDSESRFVRDVVARFKARYLGGIAAIDYKYVVKNISGAS